MNFEYMDFEYLMLKKDTKFNTCIGVNMVSRAFFHQLSMSKYFKLKISTKMCD